MAQPASEKTFLTHRFEDALSYAYDVHGTQPRKGTGIPYISHLMAVAALVLEDGGDEDEAIAALLHDAVEDQGGHARLAEIRARFGERVARIVDECTDAYTNPKPPWRPRKEEYIRHLRDEASPEARRVSLADKLHNAHSTLLDRHRVGEAVWGRFTPSREETLWQYRELVNVFREVCPESAMTADLDRVVIELEREP